MLCPPLSFSLYFPAGCSSIHRAGYRCVKQQGGKFSIYLKCETPTALHVEKSDRKYIYHLTDYANADRVNPLTSTESSLTTFSGICQQITITDSIQPLTYICFLTILTNCPRFPRILSAPSTSGSAAQYSSQLLCLSLSSITSFQQQQPTYAHQRSFSLLNTAAD